MSTSDETWSCPLCGTETLDGNSHDCITTHASEAPKRLTDITFTELAERAKKDMFLVGITRDEMCSHIGSLIAEVQAARAREVTALRAFRTDSYCLRDPLWVSVTELFCVGSTLAREWCREHGLDPELKGRF